MSARGYSGGRAASDVAPPERIPTGYQVRLTSDAIRQEVKEAVEEWFSDVNLDDLFAVKGWDRRGRSSAEALAHSTIGPFFESLMARWTREMHYRLGAHVNEGPPSADIPDELRDVRIALLDEEVREYREAAEAGDLAGIADGLADIVYVAYGTAHTYGIALDHALAEVHRSNMTKSPNPDGGKFIKGPGYSPPNIRAAIGLPSEDGAA